jgi:alkanesulfonate monooxygenase SsuD/methylene tetrahydromethanopterin reductase-like flavin-dependent oxidoreductase (luciferase family)
MKIGLFLIMQQPGSVSIQTAIHSAIRDAEEAEDLGFNTVWIAEHHGTDYSICTSPSVIAAAIAAKTSIIGIGYGVNVVPFHQPRRLVEDIALVDQLSGGRVVAGFGSGYSKLEYDIVGVDYELRGQATFETLTTAFDLWSDGKNGIKCFQKPHPPIVVACRSEDAIRSVAQSGHGILLLGGLDRIERSAKVYREVMGNEGYVGVLRHVLMHNDDARIASPVYEATSWLITRMRALTGDDSSVNDDDVRGYLNERCSIGKPNQVAADLRQIADFGVSELICWSRWGGLSDDIVLNSMKLQTKLLDM